VPRPSPRALKLTSFADGVVRVHIDEPKHPRFAVQDVLVAGVGALFSQRYFGYSRYCVVVARERGRLER
jgi:hypothetical protein